MSDMTTGRIRRVIMASLLMIIGFTAVPVTQAVERDVVIENPATELWREVRQRNTDLVGNTQVKGVDAGVLIRQGGQDWRQFRMQKLVPWSMTLLMAAIIAIAGFRILRGKLRVEGGMSGKKVPRFTSLQRTIHWFVAILFVLLAITGTVLTFGRGGLIPVIGADAFGGLAYACKRIHDFAGPAFGVGLLLMIVTFIKGNWPNDVDIDWFMKLGGFFGKHASSGRYNGGEKAWYWMVVIIGLLVVGSGLVLDFPNFGQGRETMETAHMMHSVTAILILAASLGHIYMGTIGTEGAFETMTTGYCDANWAKEHHDLWYEEMQAAGKVGVKDG